MSDHIPMATHEELLGDLNEAISRSLDALDILESVRDINAAEVRNGIVDTLVLLQRVRRFTRCEIQHEAELQSPPLGPR